MACAACKHLRSRCTEECVFAPYFPPHQPKKFSCVHQVYGTSYVAKLLISLKFHLREEAVQSLVFEAQARIRDPVYGCLGLISFLQHQNKQLQLQTDILRKQLASYVAPQPMDFMSQTQQPSFMPQTHEMFRAYGEGGNSSWQQHYQDEILRFNDGLPTGSVTATGYNQLTGMLDSLALGVDTSHMNDDYHTDQQLHYHQQHEAQFMPTQPSQPQDAQTSESEESS